MRAIRKETLTTATYLSVVWVVTGLIRLFMTLNTEDEELKLEMMEQTIFISVPAVIILTFSLIARKYLVVIDLVGPLAIISTVVTIFILNAVHDSHHIEQE